MTTADLARRIAALEAGRSPDPLVIRITGALPDTPEEAALLDAGRSFTKIAGDLLAQAEGEADAAFAARVTTAAAGASLPFAFITAP